MLVDVPWHGPDAVSGQARSSAPPILDLATPWGVIRPLAIQKAEAVAVRLALPLEALRLVFAPVIAVLNGAGARLVRMLGIPPASEHEVAPTPRI